MITTYYYDQQIKRYLTQFMAIFAGMNVVTGKGADGTAKTITVPIQYGSKDRVTSAILADNTQNKPLRLPVMSANLRTLKLAKDRLKGVGQLRKIPYVPKGGLVPQDVRIVKQLMPVPYNINVDLSIYTSNLDTHFQIIEQIALLFDPTLTLQISDSAFDWTKLVTVELIDLNYEEPYPSGTNRRMTTTTINFELPIYIAVPAIVKDDAIKQIKIRVGAVATGETEVSDEIIAALDAGGFEYETVVDAETELNNIGIN